MASEAASSLRANRVDLDRLWEIHSSEAGGGRGRPKREVDVINNAAMVLITSMWEAFCEDLLTESARTIAEQCPDASRLPSTLKAGIARELVGSTKDARDLWQLADGGWRGLVTKHAQLQVANWNTPKTRNVDQLYDEGIGLSGVSKDWYWPGSTREHATRRLDHWIGVRGAIAHRVRDAAPVHKKHAVQYADVVTKLAERMDRRVASHVESITGAHPW